ncbi:magnesium transporter [Candidatus Parcubacteria bacterium]|nr:MAG: magnesium transporter [Candidatus Parcubacteria bacterium]
MPEQEKIQEPQHKAVSKHLVGAVPVVETTTTVEDARALLRSKAKIFEDMSFVYVLTKERKLAGVVSLSNLLEIHDATTTKIGDVMNKNFPFVHPHTHQENAIKIAIANNVMSLPVVDKNGIFVGALTPKDILAILHEEHIEDLLHFGGIHISESFIDIFKAKIGTLIKLRLPWLVIGLIGGMLATSIAQLFETTLQQELTLAFFIPVIVYMSAAVGAQTQTIYIRAVALEKINTKKYLAREIGISMIIGFVVSILIALYTILVFKTASVALIVALAMFINVILAVVLAIFIPWLFNRAGKDPALGSGPFATILQDILSLLIYFSVAAALLF